MVLPSSAGHSCCHARTRVSRFTTHPSHPLPSSLPSNTRRASICSADGAITARAPPFPGVTRARATPCRAAAAEASHAHAPSTRCTTLLPAAGAASTAASCVGVEQELPRGPGPWRVGRRAALLASAACGLWLEGAGTAVSWALGQLPSGPAAGGGAAAAAAMTPEVARAQATALPGNEEQGQQLGEEGVFAWVTPPDARAASSPTAAAAPPSLPPPAAASRRFTSISEAVAACPDGGVVLVAAGRYRERLVLNRPVTVRAWPRGAAVEVVWETQAPYQSTVEVGPGASGGGREVRLQGLTIRHASKSVANNYGVFIRSGSPLLSECDISSATGAGVGVEGASPRLLGCRVHDCARQGVAIFGALSPLDLDLDLGTGLDPAAVDPALAYGMTGGVVQGCDVYGNALDGVLVRSGASPDLLENRIHNNGGVGVNLQDCGGRYERNTVFDNARGSVALSALFELDPGDLAGSNSLRGLMRRL